LIILSENGWPSEDETAATDDKDELSAEI